MAFDESLAVRIRDTLARKKGVEEKKMFGCVCFMLDGNALAGVWKDRLAVPFFFHNDPVTSAVGSSKGKKRPRRT